MSDREVKLAALRRWYEEEGNPLYAWEAVAQCLNDADDKSLPAWCLDYLKTAAMNLTTLSWGRDFRSRSRITPNRAAEMVSAALLLSKKGKRNRFAEVERDGVTMRDALDWSYGKIAADEIRGRQQGAVEPDRARRQLAKGKRLLGISAKIKGKRHPGISAKLKG